MSLVIPLQTDLNDYSFETVLDAVAYRFRIRWNVRDSRWYMDLSTQAGELIVAGVPLTLRNDLIGRHTDPRLPTGIFITVDLDETGVEPGRDDLQERVLLVYTPLAEVDAILAET